MGNWLGSQKISLLNQRASDRCFPQHQYLPFPEHLQTPDDGGLVLEFQALPPSMVRTTVPDDTFWWIDAQFLPYSDAQLVVSATAYIPRLHGAWTATKGTPKGRILVFDLRPSPISSRHITGTESTAFPKVALHPLGVAVAYPGISAVQVDSLAGEMLFIRPRDMDNRAHRFVALSPNGQVMAVLSRSLGLFYLEFFQLDVTLICYKKPILCHELCPGFRADRNHSVHVECKWSPDSTHLAISSSFGKLFIVNRTSSTNICNIFPDNLDSELSTAGSYDFDPRVMFSVMAIGSRKGLLSIVCLACAQAEDKEAIKQQIDIGGTIDCVQYNRDGTCLAVSFRQFTVRIYTTDDLSLLRNLDLTLHCGRYVEQFKSGTFPTVNRLCFSYDGRFLATSSCDGKVRVWTVPKFLTLQEWCRKSILQRIPVSEVCRCDMPDKVKCFLINKDLCQQNIC